MKRRDLLAGAGALAAAPLIDVQAAQRPSPPRQAGDRRRGAGRRRLARAGRQKVGVINNPTGILPDLSHIVDVMHASGRSMCRRVRPSTASAAARRPAGPGDHIDPRTGIMVYGAYGANASKLASLYTKSGVETVVFDIQDVGARFYTYIWTMYEAMIAPSDRRKFVVLDRRTRSAGTRAARCSSPATPRAAWARRRSSSSTAMTVGELAQLFDAEYLPLDADGRRLRSSRSSS